MTGRGSHDSRALSGGLALTDMALQGNIRSGALRAVPGCLTARQGTMAACAGMAGLC